jgi:peptide/nickel transport system permease protein
VPNVFGVIVVSATFTIADAILMLSVLSFLGLGLPPPATPWTSACDCSLRKSKCYQQVSMDIAHPYD